MVHKTQKQSLERNKKDGKIAPFKNIRFILVNHFTSAGPLQARSWLVPEKFIN